MSLPTIFTKFPEGWKINIAKPIDEAVFYLNNHFKGFFDAIKAGLLALLDSVGNILTAIPWWLMMLIVFVVGWRSSKNILKGLTYSLMLFLVGLLGLWDLMNVTLSIVIVSVIISLIIGLPIGILNSMSRNAEGIAKLILDAMQTMPTFVYLIPAVMFFGLGRVPAVIATTIYATPPAIRFTSLAINQVDKEMVEAARSFGATRSQLLSKVQIPQAVPTIMAGINQTTMMAVSMVVTCAMIGASGLGMEVLTSINRIEVGRGFTSGLAVVVIAVIMDRLTQGWFGKNHVREEGK
ncbi:MAG: ABC transporter permease subunit [Bacillota bacterium]|nr:ABC transporter permease subunit [Bacillota bacterium]